VPDRGDGEEISATS